MNSRSHLFRHGAVAIILLGTLAYALAEDLTLTTYYPSPRGMYKELRTSGDVAIGTTETPQARLQVVGSLMAPALYVVGGGGTTTLRVDAAPGDTAPFLIDSNGNVGIGTTSPSASGKLDVNGTAYVRGVLELRRLSDGTNASVLNWVDATSGKIWHLTMRSGDADKLQLYHFDGSAWAGPYLNVSTNGNVGIGTTGPTQPLDVNGQVRIRGGTPVAGEVLTSSDANGVATWEPNASAPSGMIAMFDAACPVGWTRFTALDGRFPMGDAAYGATGGTTEHSHNAAAGWTWGMSGLSVPAGGSGGTPAPSHSARNVDIGMGPQPGSSTAGLPTSTSSHIPPYLAVIWCRKN